MSEVWKVCKHAAEESWDTTHCVTLSGAPSRDKVSGRQLPKCITRVPGAGTLHAGFPSSSRQAPTGAHNPETAHWIAPGEHPLTYYSGLSFIIRTVFVGKQDRC